MAENTTNTTNRPKANADNNTSNWIMASAAGIGAIVNGIQYATNKNLSDLPGVPGVQKANAARQDALAQRFMSPQGLSDLAFNRMERGITEQSSGLIADITNQARNILQQSPLVFDALVKQAIQKAASIKESGMEKLGVFDIETVMANAQAAIQASQNATQAQFQITQQERDIESQRRQIDQMRNEAYIQSMSNFSKVLSTALGGIIQGDGTTANKDDGSPMFEDDIMFDYIADAERNKTDMTDAELNDDTLARRQRDLSEMQDFSYNKLLESNAYRDALKRNTEDSMSQADFMKRKSMYSPNVQELLKQFPEEYAVARGTAKDKEIFQGIERPTSVTNYKGQGLDIFNILDSYLED